MSIGLVYVGLLVLGVVYALIAGIFGWFSDLVGGEIHVDVSGHLDAGHAHPISGTLVATFITGFGGGGIVGHYVLEWPLLGGLGLAMGTGLTLAAAAFVILEWVFKHTQAGSEFALEGLAGREAEVITPVPEEGLGEIAVVVKGQRERGAARSVTGRPIGRGKIVVIEKVTGATFHVRAKE